VAPRLGTRVWLALATIYLVWGRLDLHGGHHRRARPAAVPLHGDPPRDRRDDSPRLGAAAWRSDRAEADRRGDRVRRRAFLGGHGALAWAQQTIPSGVAALLVGSIPLWMALLDRVVFGKRLHPSANVGLVVGFAGLAFLLDPFGAGSVDRVGAVAALLSAFAWAAGSLYSRGALLPRRPLVSAGLAALCGGVLLMIVAAASGELGDARFSWEALVAVAYLIVFGTLIGFTAYVWLLRVAPTSLVSTYAYVNPIVAVVLGWALLGEQITVQTVVAATAIVVSVTLILRSSGAALARGRSLRRSVTAAEATTR
jgi:drug/metabolite transporter (DMT)-like permease